LGGNLKREKMSFRNVMEVKERGIIKGGGGEEEGCWNIYRAVVVFLFLAGLWLTGAIINGPTSTQS